MISAASTADQLIALFVRARAEGLWFYSSYQDLWFSPDELTAEHAAGRFRWGPENWQLRPPAEYLKARWEAVCAAQDAYRAATRRVAGSKE